MTRKGIHPFYPCCLAISIVLQARLARATLGGGADSIEADRSALGAEKMASVKHELLAPDAARARSGYTVQEMRAGLTSIREYLSPSGVVFGVAWNGSRHPTLEPLLGSFFGEYRDAVESSPRRHGHGPQLTATSRLIVETWGPMRDLQGHAYVPSLIPDGVSADEIR